jgi:protease YdgD
MRLAALALGLVALASPAAAQQGRSGDDQLPTVLYGMGPDPRERVESDRLPWLAVGKLQVATGNLHAFCTAALIAPLKVLTAAHCFFNPATHQEFPLDQYHFLQGLARDSYVGAAKIVSVALADGYDPAIDGKPQGSDWAVATLDRALGTPDSILEFESRLPAAGTAVTVGGYNRDYQYVVTADEHCRVLGQAADGNGRKLLVHDCVAKQGTSGAPVLVYEGGHWMIVGVEIATGRQDTRGVASIPGGPALQR